MATPPDIQAEDPRRGEFLARRRQLEDLVNESRRVSDKLIVSGAAGALVLSITFVNVIAPHPLPVTRGWLLMAWFEFGAALVLSFLSHFTSELSLRAGIHEEDEEYAGRGTGLPPSRWRRMARLGQGSRNLDRVTQVLNLGAPVLLLLGLLSIGRFAFANARFDSSPAPVAGMTADSTALRLGRIEHLLDSLVRVPAGGLRLPPPPPPVRR